MGLMLAEPGFHTRCFVEFDDYPRRTIIAAQRAGYFAPAPIWDDLKTFDARPFAGRIDTLLAGYPCQPFSQAGQRRGENDERHLWPDVARVARELGPGLEWILLENVAGHVTLGLETVLRELWAMGFTPATGLFSASEVGASHERLRIFIVAHRGSERRERSEIVFSGRDGDQIKRRNDPKRRRRELAMENANRAGAGSDRDAAEECRRNSVDRRSEGLRCGDGTPCADRIAANGRCVADADCNANSRGMERGGSCCGPESSEVQGEERERVWPRTGSGSRYMADAGCPGLQGGERPRSSAERDGTAAHGPAAERRRPRVFPPGPGDRDGWANILRTHPDLAPALSRGGVVRAAQAIARSLLSADPQGAQEPGPGSVARGDEGEGMARQEGSVLEQGATESAVRRMAAGLADRPRALRLLGNGVHPVAAGYAFRTLAAAHGLRPLDLATTDD